MSGRPPPDLDPRPGEPGPGAFAGVRVLVVDDNALFAKATVALLAALGASADVAGDGFHALQALARAPYALVLLDWEMPRLGGRHTALEIRRRHGRELPIVIISARADLGGLGPEAGVDDVLGKPFGPAELAAVLARWARASLGRGVRGRREVVRAGRTALAPKVP
jgi:CheY-like chemotaxis protein